MSAWPERHHPADHSRPCAVSTCEKTVTAPYAEPVRLWIVDTHPAEYLHVGLSLCHEHAARASWSM